MRYEIYLGIHFFGIALLFYCIGGLYQLAKETSENIKQQKRFWLITHGVSLFLILLGGFGMLARLGMNGAFPLWVWIKLGVWVLFGGAMSLFIRKPKHKSVVLLFLFFLALVAFSAVQIKP